MFKRVVVGLFVWEGWAVLTSTRTPLAPHLGWFLTPRAELVGAPTALSRRTGEALTVEHGAFRPMEGSVGMVAQQSGTSQIATGTVMAA